jgi:hypothetical protein
MVSFKPIGRLGNFLFEAASCLSYAWEHELDYSIPSTTNNQEWNPVYLQHLVNPKFNPDLSEIHIKEKVFSHHQREFKPEWRNKNIYLDGYWQTEKYFKEYRDRIISAFGYPWRAALGTVSVHVRRGDYLTIKRGNMFKHPPVPVEWYREQMGKFPDAIFAFFSDDIQWCRANFSQQKARVLFAPRFMASQHFPLDGLSEEEQDLICMSCCEHHICSASTFSWWSAWLDQNPNKRVIIPSQWITPSWPGELDTSDIIPKEWEKV